jgi:hypothetical protein
MSDGKVKKGMLKLRNSGSANSFEPKLSSSTAHKTDIIRMKAFLGLFLGLVCGATSVWGASGVVSQRRDDCWELGALRLVNGDRIRQQDFVQLPQLVDNLKYASTINIGRCYCDGFVKLKKLSVFIEN